MTNAFDADELWFARLLASVTTPGSLERPAARPARVPPGGRRRCRILRMAGALALLVGVLGLGLMRGARWCSTTPPTG
jgi:hypothetical protein